MVFGTMMDWSHSKKNVSDVFFLKYSAAKKNSVWIISKAVVQNRSTLTLKKNFLRPKPQKSLSEIYLMDTWNAGLVYL